MHQHNIEEKLGIVFAISIGIFILELVGGIISNSLALISDSFHVMLDFVAVGISLIAFRIAKRHHTETMTFGFHRVEIVASLINGISLIVVAAFVFYEAYQRTISPPIVDSISVLVFAIIGLGANVVMTFLLQTDRKSNLNIRSTYLHVLGDLLSSVGVIGGAILMYYTNMFLIDVIVSVGIGILIVRSGITLCKVCLHIFMEGTPDEIKIDEISEELTKFPEIVDVHDLHVWTLTSNMYAMSVHVKIKKEFVTQIGSILAKINQMMKDKFGINHCTIQIEDEHDLINPK